jgi:integrase
MAKIEKLKSGKYRIRVYSHWVYAYDENGMIKFDRNGKAKKKDVYKSFTAASIRELKKKVSQFELEKNENQHCPSRINMTLRQACDKYIEQRSAILSPSTKNSYESIARNRLKFIMNKNINDITQEDIQSAINEDSKEVAPKTCKNAKGLLTAVMSAYRPNFDFNVILPARQRVEYYVPSKSEINTILNASAGTEMEIPLLLAAYGGMREGEVCAVEYNDIKKNIIHVNKSMAKSVNDHKVSWVIKSPKSYAGDRYIEYPDFVIKRIGKGTGRIVILNPQQVYKRFKDILKKCNIDDFRFHDIRHYHCSVLHSLGFPDQYVMQRLGWSTPQIMYSIYRHTLAEAEEDLNKKLTDFFKESC